MEKEQNVNQIPEEALKKAIRLVNIAIDVIRKQLEEISRDEEGDPIYVTGETSKDCWCQLSANPSTIAGIMLRYNYPVWRVLGEDAPDEMWNEIANMLGIAHVLDVDMGLQPIGGSIRNTKID